MTIREQLEQQEHNLLSPIATFSDESRGRDHPTEPCPIRTAFQRDRDRIIHCNSFRRLKHKTQVFLSPEGDHYRTRLTHTLEVSQIGRTIARALWLNEDLVEAAAMGHDLGHTPFGHAGERVFNKVLPEGFRHAEQSVRVVDRLENNGKGLNLTWEVRDAIACHSFGGEAATLEGRVVRYADKIAYMNHDIEDAVRAGVLREEDIPFDLKYLLGRTKSDRITTFVMNIIENSQVDIGMSPPMEQAFHRLREFLFEAVYTNPTAKGEEGKAEQLLLTLYEHYLAHPEQLPPFYQEIGEEVGEQRAVVDYLSGMSDRYALSVYENLFLPRSWGK